MLSLPVSVAPPPVAPPPGALPPVALPPAVPAGRWSTGRTVPNLPGALTRQLSARLGVDATTAMRIALLYGDIEWQTAGEPTVRYSARDYARRQGLHPHTVQADLRRLIAIGALEARYDIRHGATLTLCGLLDAAVDPSDPAGPSPTASSPAASSQVASSAGELVDAGTQVASPPGRSEHPALGHAVDQGWSTASTTLENSSKRTAKKKNKRATAKQGRQSHAPTAPEPQEAIRVPAQERIVPESSPEEVPPADGPCRAGLRRRWSSDGLPPSGPGSSQWSPQVVPPEALSPGALPPGALSSGDASLGALPLGAVSLGTLPPSGELLAELLEAFCRHRPQNWPAPGSLTLTTSRRRKLQQALAFAGSREALQQRLIAALAQVPPWYRQTYPQRPDGSRRPAHQFVDLLFRASAQERDCGPEAWHLFAWSESVAGGSQAAAAPQESELERARSLFHWDGFQWRCQGVEALRLPPAERRRLTALLEGAGIGVPGSGAIQFAGEAMAVPSLSEGNGAMGP